MSEEKMKCKECKHKVCKCGHCDVNHCDDCGGCMFYKCNCISFDEIKEVKNNIKKRKINNQTDLKISRTSPPSKSDGLKFNKNER